MIRIHAPYHEVFKEYKFSNQLYQYRAFSYLCMLWLKRNQLVVSKDLALLTFELISLAQSTGLDSNSN